MKRYLKTSLIVIAVIFAAMQLYRVDQTNPPVLAGESIESVVGVPADVSQIVSRSCNDCHSHKTAFPWYAQVMPFSLFLQDHIMEGREHLNLSQFATYSKEKQAHKMEELCDEVTARHMPLPSYLWIHWDAELSDSQIGVLCNWSKASVAAIERSN